jgi:hypothetical protein
MANYFLARLHERGFRVWTAGLNQVGAIRPSDVGILADPATAAEWSAAVAEGISSIKPAADSWPLRKISAQVWDPRLEALVIQRMKAVATQTNPYSGHRWADDPVFAIWELSNEQWWVRNMLAGRWQSLPAFFKNSLFARWNAYLKNKYSTDDALRSA